MNDYNPIICALDTKDVDEAKSLAEKIKDDCGLLKIGLEFFCYNGPAPIKEIQDQYLPVFLDLKLHDIPNTVAKSLESILKSVQPAMTTLHLLNGNETIERAVKTKNDSGVKCDLLGVSILTSHSDIKDIGIEKSISDQVLFLAEIAVKQGMDGVVCSPMEIELLKSNFGDDLKLVVPGIRPKNSDTGDQKRIATPNDAIISGADYLVIGRPITESKNPKETVLSIIDTIN